MVIHGHGAGRVITRQQGTTNCNGAFGWADLTPGCDSHTPHRGWETSLTGQS